MKRLGREVKALVILNSLDCCSEWVSKKVPDSVVWESFEAAWGGGSWDIEVRPTG